MNSIYYRMPNAKGVRVRKHWCRPQRQLQALGVILTICPSCCMWMMVLVWRTGSWKSVGMFVGSGCGGYQQCVVKEPGPFRVVPAPVGISGR